MKKVLITGASGLIGSELADYLLKNNYEVVQLSRRKSNGKLDTYIWDLEKSVIDSGALENVDHIIHLAGAGIADKRWTAKRKKEIIDSRVKSAELLFNKISELEVKPQTFISASAVGYYGAKTTENIFTETDDPADDFQGKVCQLWEQPTNKFNQLDIRTINLRFGVVLSEKGGALKKMLLPTKLGIGSALGSGEQFLPWIHIQDVVKIIMKVIDDQNLKGAYNLVAPSHNTYNEFAKALAKVMKKPFFMPNVPSFLLRIMLGEMSEIILEGSRISSRKITEAGYQFEFTDLENALSNLLINNN